MSVHVRMRARQDKISARREAFLLIMADGPDRATIRQDDHRHARTVLPSISARKTEYAQVQGQITARETLCHELAFLVTEMRRIGRVYRTAVILPHRKRDGSY